MSEIYSSDAVNKLLGCICNDTSLILNDKYPLKKGEKGDFSPVIFHRIIFGACYGMTMQGAKYIDPMDMDIFIKDNFGQTNYQIFIDNDGMGYIETIKELSDPTNYELYYNSVRKHSLLRRYDNQGFDIKEIWDKDKDESINEENLNKWDIDEICDLFEKKQVEIKREFTTNQVKEEYIAGTDFMEMKEKFKEEPLIGNSFQSNYLNGIFRGMFGFILRVAKSGGGKSVLSMGDLCKASITEYWDYDTQQFIKNKSRVGSGLFINTELELREELDPMIIAWISGVDRSHIIDGQYDKGEEKRVEYANKVLLDSKLYIVDDPCFTTKSLIATIKEYKLKYDIKTVCFDYIQNNGYVAKEISSETKVPQREDMVLLALTDRLKQVQRECDISLISSVQSNGQEDNMEFPMESCLAGGKAQVRKTNGTMAMFPPTKKELEQTSLLLQRKGFNQDPNYVNNVVHIIKGRGSKYPRNIKVFQHIDLGTARTIDLYCTDKMNRPIKVDKLVIEKE